MRAVDHRLGPVDLVGCVQFGEHLVESLPDAGVVPLGQPTSAGHSGTETEQDSAEHPPVVQPVAAGVSEVSFHLRQQRLDTLPHTVGDDPRWLFAFPHRVNRRTTSTKDASDLDHLVPRPLTGEDPYVAAPYRRIEGFGRLACSDRNLNPVGGCSIRSLW